MNQLVYRKAATRLGIFLRQRGGRCLRLVIGADRRFVFDLLGRRRGTAGLSSRFAALPTSAKSRYAKRQDGRLSVRCDDAPNETFGLLRNVEIGRALSCAIGCRCHSFPRWASLPGPVSIELSPSSKYSAGYESLRLPNAGTLLLAAARKGNGTL